MTIFILISKEGTTMEEPLLFPTQEEAYSEMEIQYNNVIQTAIRPGALCDSSIERNEAYVLDVQEFSWKIIEISVPDTILAKIRHENRLQDARNILSGHEEILNTPVEDMSEEALTYFMDIYEDRLYENCGNLEAEVICSLQGKTTK